MPPTTPKVPATVVTAAPAPSTPRMIEPSASHTVPAPLPLKVHGSPKCAALPTASTQPCPPGCPTTRSSTDSDGETHTPVHGTGPGPHAAAAQAARASTYSRSTLPVQQS